MHVACASVLLGIAGAFASAERPYSLYSFNTRTLVAVCERVERLQAATRLGLMHPKLSAHCRKLIVESMPTIPNRGVPGVISLIERSNLWRRRHGLPSPVVRAAVQPRVTAQSYQDGGADVLRPSMLLLSVHAASVSQDDANVLAERLTAVLRADRAPQAVCAELLVAFSRAGWPAPDALRATAVRWLRNEMQASALPSGRPDCVLLVCARLQLRLTLPEQRRLEAQLLEYLAEKVPQVGSEPAQALAAMHVTGCLPEPPMALVTLLQRLEAEGSVSAHTASRVRRVDCHVDIAAPHACFHLLCCSMTLMRDWILHTMLSARAAMLLLSRSR